MSFFGRRSAEHAPVCETDRSRPQGSGGIDRLALPEATLAFCARHRIDAAPAAYETVYTYLGGGNAALNLAMAAALARGPLTGHALAQMNAEHLQDGAALRGIGAIGAGLGREVAQMTSAVAAGIEVGSAVKSELARLTESLERVPTRQALIDRADGIREIALRQSAANTALRETLRVTQRRLTELEDDLARHMEEANTDHLSKLPNRRAIDARLAAAFAKPIDGAPVCLIMADIDNFKAINDVHGHDIGDSVIRTAADLLKRDVGAKGFPARWGGEEFAILVERCSLRDAQRLAETIRRNLEAARWSRKRDGVPLGVVTASFGVAARLPQDTAESLAKRADAALYRAKSEGRNRCVVAAEG